MSIIEIYYTKETMKKTFGLIAIFLCSLFLFAGCGIQGSSNATGIEFVCDVFYVDYYVPFFLDYKVYPSTAEDVYITYDIENDYTLESYFNFTDGSITVIDNRFTSIKVKIKVNDLEDSCEVRLKEYPTSISLDKSSDVVYGGLVYALDVQGVFSDETRYLGNGEYNYKITSSNPSVIEVISEDRLLVQSTGRRGNSKITVQICNSANQEMTGLSASINLEVEQAVEEAYATFGNSYILTDGKVIDCQLAEDSEQKIAVRYFDSLGYLIELADFDCYLSNDNVFELVSGDGGYYLKVIGEGEVVVTLQSKGVCSDGTPSRIQVTMHVQFL